MRVIPSMIYTAFLLLLVSACSEDSYPTSYTVGEADNAITLRAGLGDEGIGVQTRATETQEKHDKHTPLTPGATAILRINGWWTGHTPDQVVSQTTLATIGAISDMHNSLSMSPQLYWDDYGTADPANTAGRTDGLTILAASAGSTFTSKDAISEWTAFSWTLPTDQSNGWENADLLTSNNILDRTLKFDEVKTNTANDLLIFTHAMSKVTVNLTADEGFNGVFTNVSVKVLNAYCSGTVRIKDGTTTATTTDTKQTVTLKKEPIPTSGYTATCTGVIMPGNKYGNDDRILEITADGNIYYVTAEKINIANSATDDVFERGKNYIFQVTVNKTKIVVTATVKDWVDVEAETVSPKIDVTAGVGSGDGSSATLEAFSFYRFADESLADNAARNTGVYSDALIENECYKEESTVTPSGTGNKKDCTFGTALYWRDHHTHYHFRGVYPRTATSGTEQPLVKKEGDVQCIKVWNCPYNSTPTSFPSNLLIGAPEIEANTNCGSPYHTNVDMSEHGVCAREAPVNMNFRYMMSQVVVNLQTTAESNAVHLGANTKVEIVGGYQTGYVGLHTRSIEKKENQGAYIMNNSADVQRHDAIVPQSLDGLTFKISVMTADGLAVDDVYTATIKDIKVHKQGSSEAYSFINEWKAGEKYIYNLLITKTKIEVTATITDWVMLTADEPIWM